MWSLELVNPVAGASETRPRTIPLNAGTTSFGRTAQTPPDATEIVFPSLHISGRHAVITVVQDAPPVLQDVSSNGCKLFRSSGPPKAVKKTSVPLAEGDEVQFGLNAKAALDHIEYRYRVVRQAATQLAGATPVTAGVTRHRPTDVSPPSVGVPPTTPASTGIAGPLASCLATQVAVCSSQDSSQPELQLPPNHAQDSSQPALQLPSRKMSQLASQLESQLESQLPPKKPSQEASQPSQLSSQLKQPGGASCRRSREPSTPPVIADSCDERDKALLSTGSGSDQPWTVESVIAK